MKNLPPISPLPCSFNGRNDIVSFMLLKGASIHSVTKRGDTVLHLAASMNRLNTVELLLEGGANPTFQNVDGKYAHEMTINEAVVTTLEEALEKTKTGGMRKKEARGLYKQETLNAEQAAELVRLSLTGGPRRDSKEIDDVFQKIVDKGVAAYVPFFSLLHYFSSTEPSASDPLTKMVYGTVYLLVLSNSTAHLFPHLYPPVAWLPPPQGQEERGVPRLR